MSQTISAIASLLWPLIVLAVLVVFRGPLTRVIRSTETRDFTVRIAGQEVSVGELHRQQMDMLADLHDQVAALRQEVEGREAEHRAVAPKPAREVAVTPAFSGAPVPVPALELAETSTETDGQVEVPSQGRPTFQPDPVKAPWERLEHHEPEPDEHPEPEQAVPAQVDGAELVPGWVGQHPDTRPKPAGVLWVDDHPEHNALQVDQLERRGVVVDSVRSTKEALQKLTGQRYQLIVSDMERVEGGKPVANAGLELIRTVRTFDRDTPVVIFTAGPGGKVLADTATQIGADLVTRSWFQLSQEMHRIGVL